MELYGKIIEIWSDRYLIEVFHNNKLIRGWINSKNVSDGEKEYLLSGSRIVYYNTTKTITSVYRRNYKTHNRLLEYKQQSNNN